MNRSRLAPRTRARHRAGARALTVAMTLVLLTGTGRAAEPLPVFDAHIHYSHDAWDVVPTADVISLMRRAGLRRALVSSSDDEGTQRLLSAAPDLVVPSLRPYRKRGEIGTWMRDGTILAHLEQRLARHRYAAIGEFHLYGADADLPVPRAMVALARRHGLILHAHSDADAVERLFAQDPDARILWAHAGFARPGEVAAMLRRHPRLRADLAFRNDMGGDGRVDPDWAAVFAEFPDRFMVGTDTFTPERLHYIPPHAEYTRGWLRALPPDLAERIAWRNAEEFVGTVWEAQRTRAGAGLSGQDPAAGQSPSASHPLPAAGGSPTDPAGAACAAAAAEPGTRRLDGTRISIVYRTPAGPPRVGEPFRVAFAVCPSGATEAPPRVDIDARMPEHRHGMNYTPSVVVTGPGRFAAEGLVFHMPGRWTLSFDVRGPQGERLEDDLVLR
ncbi:MAG: hypothetical protein RIS35_3577 [Pseudomonadota bacterium]